MNIKINCGILAFAICLVLGGAVTVAIGSPGEDPNSIKERLHQAVENARKGNRMELEAITEAIARGDKRYISDKLLPDYASLLKDADGQVQFLGAQSLYALKNPKSKEPLLEYLKGKDFAKLEKMRSANQLDPQQYLGQIRASALAIMTLGKLGDKSAIPLLESIRQKINLELEWGYSPVEEALVELGEVKTLSNISPGADEGQIRRATRAIQQIRDPNMVSELMSIVCNKAIVSSIRGAALYALGEIGSSDVAGFLLGVVNDPNYPEDMRLPAVVMAGKTKDPTVEKPLLAHAENRNSNIRPYAIVGLTLYMPERYLDKWFEKIIDPNEEIKFREKLAGTEFYLPRNLLVYRRQQLYNCLNVVNQDGYPIDEIRIKMWCLINELFGEQPSIVLRSKSSLGLSTLKSIVQNNLRQQWQKEPWKEPSIEELEKMADEKLKSIVTFLPKEGESKQ